MVLDTGTTNVLTKIRQAPTVQAVQSLRAV
jgi:hypothetical protein